MDQHDDVWVRTSEAEADPAGFRERAAKAEVVCVGDSITGWNNFGPASEWPVQTYPRFLQRRIADSGLPWRVADAGVAGETSAGGVSLLRRCISNFPGARWFAIGFGANDLAGATEPEQASGLVIEHLDRMVRIVRDARKAAVLLEVTPAWEGQFLGDLPEGLASGAIRAHNSALRNFAAKQGIQVAEVFDLLGSSHLVDGVHPTVEGARIIAEEVFEALAKDERFAPARGDWPAAGGS